MNIDDTKTKERLERELDGRKEWIKYEPPYELLFTIEITDNCTLKCDHCFASSSPENNTFIDADLIENRAEDFIELFKLYSPVSEKMAVQKYSEFKSGKLKKSLYGITKLVKAQNFLGKKTREIKENTKETENESPSSIRITGGDPFLHPKLYDIIKSFSSRKNLMQFSGIDVETNGWWATDDKTTKDIILKTKKAGANLISMTNDYWHQKDSPFPNNEYGDRIERIAKKVGFRFRYITVGSPISSEHASGIAPVGRGRFLDEKYWDPIDNSEECRLSPSPFFHPMSYVKTDEVTIGPQGSVYLCNSGREFKDATLSIGNLYQKPITQIIKEDFNPIVRLLREKGTRGLTELLGMPLKEHYSTYDKMTPCGLCHEMLRVHGKKINSLLKDNKN